MDKGLLSAAVVVIATLAAVWLQHHRNPTDDFSYDLHGVTALLIHDEAEGSRIPVPNLSATERPSKEDVEKLWPLAREWVVAHHCGARITNIGLRHMEVAAQSDSASVFVSVYTERGSFVYELKFEWIHGWRVTQWFVAPQDHKGQENIRRPR